MKNLLLTVNSLYPERDHLSDILLQLTPYIADFDQKILSLDLSEEGTPPAKIDGVPVFFTKKRTKVDKLFMRLLKKVLGENLATELTYYFKMRSKMRKIPERIDAAISIYIKPYALLTVSKAKKHTVKAVYLMDPFPSMFEPHMNINDEPKMKIKALEKYDVIFTTRFIKEAMLQKGYDAFAERVVEVSFPLITGFSYESSRKDDDKITLLFAGTIYNNYRFPKYYFKIVERLDSRFKVVFVGENCDSLNKLDIKTDAEIVALPRVPYEEIQQMIADADILINIGNAIPVHIPSKTLEYINSGKPFVNFYKFDECPTLYYTRKYPLCLNIDERNDDIEGVTKEFIDFCVNSKGKKMDREWINKNYEESTPAFIAKVVEKTLLELIESRK